LIDEINRLLGTKLELRGVTLKELEKLRNAISAKLEGSIGLPFGKNMQGLLDAPLIKVLKKRITNKKLEDMTVRDFVSALHEGTDDKGLFGLGILPRFFGSRRRK